MQGPEWGHPVYTSRVTSGQMAGVLDISPDTLHAMDRDSLRSEIQYSWVSGSPPEYASYFSIDSRTGVVRQVSRVKAQGFSQTINH